MSGRFTSVGLAKLGFVFLCSSSVFLHMVKTGCYKSTCITLPSVARLCSRPVLEGAPANLRSLAPEGRASVPVAYRWPPGDWVGGTVPKWGVLPPGKASERWSPSGTCKRSSNRHAQIRLGSRLRWKICRTVQPWKQKKFSVNSQKKEFSVNLVW